MGRPRCTSMSSDPFVVAWKEAPEKELVPGIRARVVHGDQLSLSLVEIDPDADLPAHDHPNEQAGWVLDGELHFTVEGEPHTVRTGEAYLLRGGVKHGARAGPQGCRVLDVFAPVRSDYEGLVWAAGRKG